MFFRKKDQEDLQFLRESVEGLHEELSAVKGQLDEVQDQMQKSARLSYKSGKGVTERLERVDERLKAIEAGGSAVNPSHLPEYLIKQVDDFDTILASMSQDDAWYQVMASWREEALFSLKKAGIHTAVKQGDRFDPSVAEAIDAVAPDESARPFDIMDVSRRAFVDGSGNVIRKGQVTVVKEAE